MKSNKKIINKIASMTKNTNNNNNIKKPNILYVTSPTFWSQSTKDKNSQHYGKDPAELLKEKMIDPIKELDAEVDFLGINPNDDINTLKTKKYKKQYDAVIIQGHSHRSYGFYDETYFNTHLLQGMKEPSLWIEDLQNVTDAKVFVVETCNAHISNVTSKKHKNGTTILLHSRDNEKTYIVDAKRQIQGFIKEFREGKTVEEIFANSVTEPTERVYSKVTDNGDRLTVHKYFATELYKEKTIDYKKSFQKETMRCMDELERLFKKIENKETTEFPFDIYNSNNSKPKELEKIKQDAVTALNNMNPDEKYQYWSDLADIIRADKFFREKEMEAEGYNNPDCSGYYDPLIEHAKSKSEKYSAPKPTTSKTAKKKGGLSYLTKFVFNLFGKSNSKSNTQKDVETTNASPFSANNSFNDNGSGKRIQISSSVTNTSISNSQSSSVKNKNSSETTTINTPKDEWQVSKTNEKINQFRERDDFVNGFF